VNGPIVLSHGKRVVAVADVRQVLAAPLSSSPVTFQVVALVSEDGGRTWGSEQPGPTLSGPEQYVAAGALPVIDGAGRLVLLDGRRLWTSADGGVSWSARVAVLPEDTYPLGPLQAAGGTLLVLAATRPIPHAVAPTAATLVPQQLLRSRDGGVHWERVSLPKPGA
jgi:hypothetical protein